MAATRYRAPLSDELIIAPLDELVAVFHRTSGITHLVVPSVPDLLEILSARWMTLAEMEDAHDLVDGDSAGLLAALEALTVAGLIEAA